MKIEADKIIAFGVGAIVGMKIYDVIKNKKKKEKDVIQMVEEMLKEEK